MRTHNPLSAGGACPALSEHAPPAPWGGEAPNLLSLPGEESEATGRETQPLLPIQDLFERPRDLHARLVDQREVIAHPLDEVEVLGGQENGAVRKRALLKKHLQVAPAVHRIEATHRLVDDQEFWLAGEGQGERAKFV